MGYLYRPKLRSGEPGSIWWVKYYQNGRPIRESTGTEKETEARTFIKQREGDVAHGRRIIPRVERVRFEDLAQDYLNDYQANGRRSLKRAKQNVAHLEPFFHNHRAVNITTAHVRAYTARRQEEGAANGTINRELTALRRMFNLALQAEKIRHKPHIPHLKENNTRQGFFEAEAFRSVAKHLPEYLEPVVTFAYITGWRVQSEILPLTWPQVDFQGGVVRLEPGTTKNE